MSPLALVTLSEAARALGLTHAALARRVLRAGLQPAGKQFRAEAGGHSGQWVRVFRLTTLRALVAGGRKRGAA